MQRAKVATLILGIASASVLAGCSGGGAALMPSGPSAVGAPASVGGGGGLFLALDSGLPQLIVPEGISCPSDAPRIRVGTFINRMDVDWTPIPGIERYEVAFERRLKSGWVHATALEVIGSRLEWYGGIPGVLYRIRVRSKACGTTGQWSESQERSLDGAPPPPEPASNDDDDTETENVCQAPGAPTNLSASLTGSTLTLTWGAPVSGGAPTSYLLEGGTSPGDASNSHSVPATQTSLSTTMPKGQYYVRVRALNACGAGPTSGEVTVQR